jgi:hypothetical protein
MLDASAPRGRNGFFGFGNGFCVLFENDFCAQFENGFDVLFGSGFGVLIENDVAFDLGTASALNLRTGLAFYSGAQCHVTFRASGMVDRATIRACSHWARVVYIPITDGAVSGQLANGRRNAPVRTNMTVMTQPPTHSPPYQALAPAGHKSQDQHCLVSILRH